MTKAWTIQRIKELEKAGKIRGYKEVNPAPAGPEIGGRKVAKHFKKRSKEKDFIGWNLLIWCQERCLVLEEEYKFHPDRQWRFDHAIPALMIAVEFEGIISDKSRHTTITGYTGDAEKYNAAQALGWKVIRFTALNYKELISELNKHCAK